MACIELDALWSDDSHVLVRKEECGQFSGKWFVALQ